MNDMKALERLAPIADEMLSGLHADDGMKRRIREAAVRGRTVHRPVRLVPALCCAALAVACVGIVGVSRMNDMGALPQTVQIAWECPLISASKRSLSPSTTIRLRSPSLFKALSSL